MCRNSSFAVLLLVAVAGFASAQDANVTRPVADLDSRLASMPFEIEKADKARGVAQDVALKSDVRFADGVEMRIKIRPANVDGSEFNNEPRYEVASYRLQTAFLDEPDYVVPPTAVRALPKAYLATFAPAVVPTFRNCDDVVVVVQYWLQKISGPPDIWQPERFASDPDYAHHIADLNVLTYLMKHGDSNAGNFLISTEPGHARVFAVDNGVAFRAPKSDRGELWSKMRVPRVSAHTIERLRALDVEKLEALLMVVATWDLQNRHLVALPGHERIGARLGVRHSGNLVQMGLTREEVADVDRRRRALLSMVDHGELGTF